MNKYLKLIAVVLTAALATTGEGQAAAGRFSSLFARKYSATAGLAIATAAGVTTGYAAGKLAANAAIATAGITATQNESFDIGPSNMRSSVVDEIMLPVEFQVNKITCNSNKIGVNFWNRTSNTPFLSAITHELDKYPASDIYEKSERTGETILRPAQSKSFLGGLLSYVWQTNPQVNVTMPATTNEATAEITFPGLQRCRFTRRAYKPAMSQHLNIECDTFRGEIENRSQGPLMINLVGTFTKNNKQQNMSGSIALRNMYQE